MSPAEKKRLAAYKMACAINAVEGVPVSRYAKALSHSWVRGELTGEQMKKALLDHHRRIAQQESRTMYDPYLYEDVPVLKKQPQLDFCRSVYAFFFRREVIKCITEEVG